MAHAINLVDLHRHPLTFHQLLKLRPGLWTIGLTREFGALGGLWGSMPNIRMRSLVWFGVITVSVSPSAMRSTVLSSRCWGFLVAGDVLGAGAPVAGLLT